MLDFTHAICYVYAAAMAGRLPNDGWPEYCQWAQWLWSGAVDELIAAVAARSEELGPPTANDSDTSPRNIVAGTLRYLKNQRTRMHYDDYRRSGLPITSSHIESAIKQINAPVKGTEKFWRNDHANAILQLRADSRSPRTNSGSAGEPTKPEPTGIEQLSSETNNIPGNAPRSISAEPPRRQIRT